MSGRSLRIELRAEPLPLTVSTRDRLRISLIATNEGTAVIDPELHRAELLVDGERSSAFSLAVGNGRREDRWYELPPGESVAMTWSTLGESLLPGRGEFTLLLHIDANEATPITVPVLDD